MPPKNQASTRKAPVGQSEREVLYTTEEVATLMKVTSRTVQRWIREKKLEAVRVGGRYRIPDSVLQSFIGKK